MQTWANETWLRNLVKLAVVIGVPAIILGLFLTMKAEFRDSDRLRAASEATVASRNLLADLLTLHNEAETSVRGFVLTGDERFLRPYVRAAERRPEILDALFQGASPALRERLPELGELSDAKLASGKANIERVRAGRTDEARAVIAAGGGARLMDDIRRDIARLDANEVARLRDLTARRDESRAVLENSVTVMLVSLFALLMLSAYAVNRSLRLRQIALQRAELSNARQQAMFDGAVDGMLLLDEEGRIKRMNPSISRMFGYGEQDLLGKHNLFLMDEVYSLKESAGWLASVGSAGTHGAGRRQEFVGKRADGSIFETEVAISRVSDEPRRRYVAAIRDISDRKRAERMKTEFVSTVSHELRTPLTSIAGSLGLLGAGAVGPLNEKARRLVEIAHSNCERLVRLINDILDIEKIESGKMEFDLRRMQAAPLINRTVEAMRGYAEKHDVTIKTTLPPWPQCLKGDPDKLEQLLTNLLSNAIKHSPPGGQVEVFSTQERDQIRIEVRDRGAGVPDEFRGRIFGKFAMADASDSRAKGGTGLGLAIAREIARRHGGEVGFDDRDGGGTIFHFGVPLAKSDDVETAAKSDPSLPRLLHLDDDQDTLVVAASAFAGKANLVPAHTLAQARELLAQGEAFAGAIIDVGLAYESGLDIVPDLRKANPEMPIILFTAMDDAHDTADADRVMIKSRASFPELVEATLDALAKRRKAA